MPEYTVTRDGGAITVHEGGHDTPPIATFTGMEGEELFDLMVATTVATGTAAFWDANRAETLG